MALPKPEDHLPMTSRRFPYGALHALGPEDELIRLEQALDELAARTQERHEEEVAAALEEPPVAAQGDQ
jgi:hypothetical protein